MVFSFLTVLLVAIQFQSGLSGCADSQSNVTFPGTNQASANFDEFIQNLPSVNFLCILITENTTISVVKFQNSTFLSIVGANHKQKIILTCSNHEGGLFFHNISNLSLENLRIVQCGMIVNSTGTKIASTPQNYTNWKIKTAVHIGNSSNVAVTDIEILNSSGVGLVFANTGGRILISSCEFKTNRVCSKESCQNEINEYPGGGGLHIELNSLSNARYEIEECDFEGNVASIPFVEKTAYVLDGTSQFYGRGGGLFIGLAGNSSSNVVQICNCHFEDNMAVWGGAIALYVVDYVQRTEIFIFNCTFDNNSSPMFGGGGAVIKFEVTHYDTSQNSSIVFEKCQFNGNKAVFGGGLELTGGQTGTNTSSLIHFIDCTFHNNEANSSAAVDITVLKQSKVMTGLSIRFTGCNFTGNRVIDDVTPIQNNTATQVQSGTGTFTVLYLSVTFCERVWFENNTGTALYVIAAFVNFDEGIEAVFLRNRGYNGGAIALIASSVMTVKNNSSFIFDGNTAGRSGAAIFALNIGLHQLHKIVVTTCFIMKSDNYSESVNFYFAGNFAGVGNTGGAIYSDNLQACRARCNGSILDSTTEVINTDSLFSCVGILHFCENCSEGMDCYNCSLSADKNIRGLPDQFETNKDVPIPVYPGQEFDIGTSVFDEVGNDLSNNYYVAEIEKPSEVFIDRENLHVTDNSVKISGKSPANATLTLHRLGFRDYQLKINVSVLECPPGYALNSNHQCSCRDDQHAELYRGVLCKDGARIVHGKWMGYIGKNYSPQYLHTSLCPYGFCTYNVTETSQFSSSYSLAVNYSALERFVCGPTREGRACGKCVGGFSVHYNSPQFTCNLNSNSCKYGWLFYILADLLPITVIYVVVVVILNISFTSGLVSGFIFYAQVIDSLEINANGINGLKPSESWIKVLNEMYTFIYNSFNLEFFGLEKLSFCLWSGAGILDILIMRYVAIVYAFLLVLGTVFALNRVKLCCRCTRSKSCQRERQNHIIHGLSAFFISCYVQCMRVTFLILTPTHLEGFKSNYSHYSIVYVSGHLDYMKGHHLYYALPAFLCVVVLLIPIPTALLVYPLFLKLFSLCGLAESKMVKCLSVPFDKAKPLLDSFQSSYKDNFRFVAGLFFVYRVLILFSYAASVGYGQFYVALGILLLVMLILHFLMQPHRVHCHNILDMLIFSNLAAINSLSLYKFGISYQHDSNSMWYVKVASILQLVLIYTPMVVVIIWVLVILALALKRKVKPKTKSLISPDSSDDDVDYSSYDNRSIRLASFN